MHLLTARRAFRNRSPAEPVRVEGGELVLGVRWVKWTVVAGLLALLCVLAAQGAWLTAQGRAWVPALAFAGFAALLLYHLVPLVRFALAAQRAGAAIRADAFGLRHCLLPLVPWRHLHGVDTRDVVVGKEPVLQLSLAIDPALAPALVLPRWLSRRSAVPALDAQHRLTIPLAFVRGEPLRVAGQLQFLATRYGAPSLAGWRGSEAPQEARERLEDARRREEQAREEQQAVRAVQARMLREARSRTLSAAEQAAFAAELQQAMSASLQRSQRMDEQMDILVRKTAHLQSEAVKVRRIFGFAGVLVLCLLLYAIHGALAR